MNEPSAPAPSIDELTVLLVADGERMAHALAARLTHRGLTVETATVEAAASTAFVVAPDMVVLAGDASRDRGLELLSELASRAGTSTLPVVLIADQEEDQPRRAAFRHGIVGVVDRTASADQMAHQIEEIARDLPERDGLAAGRLEEASLDDVVELFAESLRSGILSVSGGSSSAQIMIRADRPVQEAIGELVERIRPMLADENAGPLHYEFHESPTARLSRLDVFDEVEEGDKQALAGRRILLVEQNPASADVLSQALRAVGVTLSVVDGQGKGIELAHDLMPEVVLLDGRGVEGWATEALRRIRRDARLRWASLLMVDADRLWANPRRPDVAMLGPKVLALVKPDDELAKRVSARPSVLTRLDIIGPVRLLRALSSTQLGLRLLVQHPRVRVEIDLAEGLVAGATAFSKESEEEFQGLPALAALTGLASGRVHITREDAPRTANVMTPTDVALTAAAEERPAVAPSIPPPSMIPPPPAPTTSAPPGEADNSFPKMVRKLEVLLEALSRTAAASVPPPEAPAPAASEASAPARQDTKRPSVAAQRKSELPPFDDDFETEISGMYEPGLMDQLRKRVQHGPKATVPRPGVSAAGVAKLPAPTASVATLASPSKVSPWAKPSKLPPSKRPPKPARKQPRAARPEKSQRRVKRPIRSGSQTLVLGSVRDDGTAQASPAQPGHTPPGKAPTASAPPPPPPAASAPPRPRTEPPDDTLVASKDELAAQLKQARAPSAPPPFEPPAALEDRPDAPTIETAALPERELGSATPIEYAPPAADTAPPPVTSAAAAPSAPPPPPPVSPSAPLPSPANDALSFPDPGPEQRLEAPEFSPKKRSVLPLALAGAGALFVVAALGGGLLYWASSDDTDDTADLTDGETSLATGDTTPDAPDPLPDPEPAADPPVANPDPDAPLNDEAAPPEAGPAPTAAIPGPDEPLEGSDEGFALADFGITPLDAPTHRRRRNRLRLQLIQRANRLRRDGELDNAETAYQELLGRFPESPRGTAGLARVHIERGDHAGALPFAQRLVRLRPVFANNWLFLGDVYRDTGHPDVARRAYQQALELEPRWEPALRRILELRER